MANATVARTTIPDGYLTFHVGATIFASPSFREMDEAVAEYATNRGVTMTSEAGSPNNPTNPAKPSSSSHKISKAGRERLAAAQRERWAKQKSAKGKGKTAHA